VLFLAQSLLASSVVAILEQLAQQTQAWVEEEGELP
jgi:hypothetical protein